MEQLNVPPAVRPRFPDSLALAPVAAGSRPSAAAAATTTVTVPLGNPALILIRAELPSLRDAARQERPPEPSERASGADGPSEVEMVKTRLEGGGRGGGLGIRGGG